MSRRHPSRREAEAFLIELPPLSVYLDSLRGFIRGIIRKGYLFTWKWLVHCQGKQLCEKCFAFLFNRDLLCKKRICSLERKLFPVRMDHILKRLLFPKSLWYMMCMLFLPRHVAELAPPHSHFVPMILSSDIRKHFTGIECDQLQRLENKNNDNMSFGTTLDDLTTIASSYPSTRGKVFTNITWVSCTDA